MKGLYVLMIWLKIQEIKEKIRKLKKC